MALGEDRIPQIIAEIQAGCEEVVSRSGLLFEAEAKKRARVRTGNMRREIRWIPDEENPLQGEIIGGARYTVYNEFGTAFMAPQPMFLPAAEIVRPIFQTDLRLVLKRAAEG